MSNPSDDLTQAQKINPTIIALIPARAGSKRVPGKNVRRLGKHPLLAYTIAAAIQSKVFSSIVVSTDSTEYAEIAKYYGAEVPLLRPSQFAGDLSPDIEWIDHALQTLRRMDRTYHCFSILRPTSPFRKPETIRRAWNEFRANSTADSLRAVEKCSQHPCKMWIVRGKRMTPLLALGPPDRPWHSSQYQVLPEVYVQNASLEIAWSRVVFEDHSIAGNVVVPFHTIDYEGFDVNRSLDWRIAEDLVQQQPNLLPSIEQAPWR